MRDDACHPVGRFSLLHWRLNILTSHPGRLHLHGSNSKIENLLNKNTKSSSGDKGAGAQENRKRKGCGSWESGGWGVRVLKGSEEVRNRIGHLFTAPILKAECLISDRFLWHSLASVNRTLVGNTSFISRMRFKHDPGFDNRQNSLNFLLFNRLPQQHYHRCIIFSFHVLPNFTRFYLNWIIKQ